MTGGQSSPDPASATSPMPSTRTSQEELEFGNRAQWKDATMLAQCSPDSGNATLAIPPPTRTQNSQEELEFGNRESEKTVGRRSAFTQDLMEVKNVFPGITPWAAGDLAQRCDRLSNAKRAALAFGASGLAIIGWSAYALIAETLAFMTLCGVGSGCLVVAAMFLGLTIQEVDASNLARGGRPKADA